MKVIESDYKGVFTSAAPCPGEGTLYFLVLVQISVEAFWMKEEFKFGGDCSSHLWNVFCLVPLWWEFTLKIKRISSQRTSWCITPRVTEIYLSPSLFSAKELTLTCLWTAQDPQYLQFYLFFWLCPFSLVLEIGRNIVCEQYLNYSLMIAYNCNFPPDKGEGTLHCVSIAGLAVAHRE